MSIDTLYHVYRKMIEQYDASNAGVLMFALGFAVMMVLDAALG